MAASLTLLGLFLLPARGAALRGDDEWVFGLRGQLMLSHKTLADQISSDISGSLRVLRPQFLADVFSDPVVYIFNGHPALYRLYLVALTVICGVLVWALVRRLGGSTPLAALVIAVFAGAVQFRFYHDAMLGYYGVTQWALGFVLASLLAMLKSMRGGSWRWATAAGVLFACGCMMQEWVYPLAATHLCLALAERRGRKALVPAFPALVVGAVFLLGGIVGSGGASSQPVAAGYNVSLNVGHVIGSYVTQLIPPVPGTDRLFPEGPVAYFYGNASAYPLGGHPTPAELFAALWRGFAVFGVVLLFALWTFRRGVVRIPDPRVGVRLLAIGIPFWLAPPIFLSVAEKYQVELAPDRGYLGVLVQEVGFALVAAAALISVVRLAERRSRTALICTALTASLLLGFAAGVDGFNNLRIVALEQPVRRTRDLLETAAKNGALNVVPRHSTLLFSGHDMNWPTGSWLFGTNTGEAVLFADSGRAFDVRYAADQTAMDCPPVATFPPPICAPPEPSAAWVRVRARPGGGVVIVSRLTKPTAATIEKERSTNVFVYTEQSGESSPAPPPLVGTLPDGRPWSSANARWTKVRAGREWAIYQARFSPTAAPVAYSLDYPLSKVNFWPLPPPDQDVRIFGVKDLLP